MKRYRACVVGGGAGGRLSLNALRTSDRYEAMAVADISPVAREALARDFPGVAIFEGHEGMFAQCPADVICVSTWAPSHRAVAEAALRLPLTGILVEKPLAETAADGAAILAAIRAKNLPLAVPHGLLVAAHAKEILQRVRGGEIGDLLLVEIQCTGWDIINAGIHWLNYAYVLNGGGPIESVMAACDISTRTYRDGVQVETAAVTYAEAKNGVRFVMNTGDYVRTTRPGKDTVFHVVGTKGTIEFWAWESAYALMNSQYPGGELFRVPPAAKGGHLGHLDKLAEEMDQGRVDYGIGESSLAALEMCEAAYLAARHGCKVDLPLSTFTPPPAGDWQVGRAYSGTGGGRDGRKLP